MSRRPLTMLVALPLVAACAMARQGDPPEPIPGEPTAGESGETGGSATGGTSSGGSATGGSATGGSATGGSTTGGSSSGGSAGSSTTGGSAGNATGGSAGSATGGAGGQGGGAGSASGGTAGTAGGTGGRGGSGGSPSGGTGGGAAGGPPSGMELFRDDFEMGTASWSPTPAGVWATSMDGSTVYGSTGATGSSAMRAAAAGEPSWTNVQIEARVKITRFAGTSSGYYAGVCARYQSTENYACFALRSNGQVMFRVNGSNTAATSAPGGAITENVWYNVRVVAVGSNITAFVNGTEIASNSRVTASDGPPASGRIAVASPGTDAVFDDIVVTTP